MLARMRAAGALAQVKPAEAVKAYDEISADASARRNLAGSCCGARRHCCWWIRCRLSDMRRRLDAASRADRVASATRHASCSLCQRGGTTTLAAAREISRRDCGRCREPDRRHARVRMSCRRLITARWTRAERHDAHNSSRDRYACNALRNVCAWACRPARISIRTSSTCLVSTRRRSLPGERKEMHFPGALPGVQRTGIPPEYA